MSEAAILAHVQGDWTDSKVCYFGREGCVDRRDSPVAVYIGGNLIGTYTEEQPVERDLLIMVVCREPRVRVNRVAEAFGVSTQTVRRIRRRHDSGGLQAIARSHRRGGLPRRQTPVLEDQVFALFDAGVSISQAHQRLGEAVSRSVVARAHKKWVTQRSEPTEAELEAAVAERLPVVAPVVVQEPATALELPAVPDTSPEDDSASPDELELEQACAHGGRRVQYLGSWIVLAVLHALGLYALAERLRQRQERSAGQRFLGAVTLRAALDAVAIALSIGKRCVEGVRWLATPSGPTLLRRSQAISASWARRVLARFGTEVGLELHWEQATSLAAGVREGDDRAVFYLDNHLRPYTGQQTIRKGWRMQDKRARPGVSDYYVHDEQGRPLVRVDDPSHGTLADWLGPMAKLLREALGGQTTVLVAFDRAGAYAEHLASLRDDQLEFVTYERAPYRTLPDSAFRGQRWLTVGRKRVRVVEGPYKNLGQGRGRVRRIHVQTESGSQLSVLAVSQAPAKVLVTVLLRRWSCQENQFKHENERWGLNQLDGRRVEDYPADEVIPNPARRRLDHQLRIARMAEGEALRHLAALDEQDPRRELYEDDLEQARELQRELEAQRPQVPTHAPVSETELAGELVRHPGQYKLVIDTLRIALANVESDLAAWLGPELPKPAEAKKTLAKLFEAPGTVRPNGKTITVSLAPAGTRPERAAFESLMSRLNRLDLQLPGDPSGRVLRFKLDNQ